MKKILNFMKNTKVKSCFILIILLSFYVFICAYSYVQAISEDLQNSVFRLHVIANSDSEEDQNLKYIVRDNLLNYMKEICKDCTNKEEAIKIVTSNLEQFKQIAENTVKEQGYSYNINLKIGEFEFPTKTYGDISFPAGIYDALKVEIGEASGHNWWCVMFPPLCFVDITSGTVPDSSKEMLENELNEEEFALISDDSSSDIQFKFKLLELFSNTGLLTAKN